MAALASHTIRGQSKEGGMPTRTDDKLKRLGSMELFRHCTGRDLEAIAAITGDDA
jgi:hypothetical protein